MATYVLRDGRMVNKVTGELMNNGPWEPAAPMVQGDYDGYLSPVTGEWIEGKRARRYDLDKHNCVDARDFPTLGGKFKNKRFARKRGLPLSEDAG